MDKQIKQKFKNLKKIIGNTPLIEITYLFRQKSQKVYAKLEWFSLTGSIKDRVAYQILYDAYKNNVINNSTPIYELTSGNMGISLAALGNMFGNKTTVIMPKDMSEERKKLIKLYGAELIEVDDFLKGFELCEKLSNEGKFLAHQFENNSNFKAHYQTTGKEIYKKLKFKKLDAFVAGVGTSGTLMGVGKFLKYCKQIKIVGIEPKNAKILSGKKPFAKHKLQGLADEILPKLYDKNLIDDIVQISDEDAISMAQKLSKKLGLGVGISSGANFLGCALYGKNCVTTFADDNKKYLSTDLCDNIITPLVSQIRILNIKVL